MDGQKLLKITGVVFVAVEQDADPEDIASQFSQGFEPAVSHFPGGDVMGADVLTIENANDEEKRLHFEE